MKDYWVEDYSRAEKSCCGTKFKELLLKTKALYHEVTRMKETGSDTVIFISNSVSFSMLLSVCIKEIESVIYDS